MSLFGSRSRARGLALVGVSLLASVLVAGLYVRAVRAHARAVETAGQRIAGVIARDLLDMVFIETFGAVSGVFRDAINPYAIDRLRAGVETRPDVGEVLERLELVVDSLALCDCGPAFHFTDIVVADERGAAPGDGPGTGIASRTGRTALWRSRLAASELERGGDGRLQPAALVDDDGTPWFAIFAGYPDEDSVVVGLEFDLDRYGAVLLDDGLPRLAGSYFATSPVDSVLAVELVHPGGRVIYRQGEVGVGPTQRIALFGNDLMDHYAQLDRPLEAVVTITPGALPRLIPGGEPRLAILPILLVLSALGFGVAGIRMVQREKTLAEARQRFLLSVQHEMRTPLAQIRAYGETLQLNRPTPEARRRAGDVIVREADRLSSLVENALDVVRAPGDRASVRVAPHPVDEVVARLEGSVSLLLAERQLRLESVACPGVQVDVDPDVVHRLLLTILENAIRFSPRGAAIELDVEVGAEAVTVRIVDHGPGIPAEQRSRIWEPFETLERGRPAEGGQGSGTGLGLAIARELAGAAGWGLSLDETPGGGATFGVRLPRARAS